MKAWLRRTHLILALASAIFLINLSITGAFLVFAKDIQAWLNPQYWSVPDPNNPIVSPATLPVSEIAKRIRQISSSAIVFIEHSASPSRAWQVRLADKSYVSINQYSGDVLLHYQYDETFYGFTMAWHRWLLYSDGDAHPLALLPPLASLILCIELLLGFYLWVRPKNRLKRLKVKWKAKNKIRFMQLHNVLGVYSLIPLFLIAFSGLAFYFKDATQQIVEAITLSRIQTPRTVILPQTTDVKSLQTRAKMHYSANYQLDKAVASAQDRLKDATIYRVYLPQSSQDPLKIRMRMPNESHAYSYSWSNPYTGASIDSFDASQMSLATRVWNFKYSFHIGDFMAPPIKFLWLFLSLLPLFFVGSGFYLYIKRQSKPRTKLVIKPKNNMPSAPPPH
ncbi:PepSY-associated TM helix domain-containing protein [Paraglaciecola sp. 20A4]|uniref:PepSY domain-containing protein n=1 Tax=Paraglaciecola sp. 20A4 TaxID=2687288 RepID=UPI001409D844